MSDELGRTPRIQQHQTASAPAPGPQPETPPIGSSFGIFQHSVKPIGPYTMLAVVPGEGETPTRWRIRPAAWEQPKHGMLITAIPRGQAPNHWLPTSEIEAGVGGFFDGKHPSTDDALELTDYDTSAESAEPTRTDAGP